MASAVQLAKRVKGDSLQIFLYFLTCLIHIAKLAGMSSYMYEVLSCPVCLELYSEPKSLDCGHSLCTNCVDNLCKAAVSSARKGTIPTLRFDDIDLTFLFYFSSCPQCRQSMPANADFKLNYALRDVITRYTFLDRQTSYRYCAVCRQLREKKSIFAAVGECQSKEKHL